jgi:hypothetical protein
MEEPSMGELALTAMTTRRTLERKAWPACKADNLIEPIFQTMWDL